MNILIKINPQQQSSVLQSTHNLYTLDTLKLYKLDIRIQPYQNRVSPLTTATSAPIYSYPQTGSILTPQQLQSTSLSEQAQSILYNFQSSQSTTPTPSSNRRPILIPPPVYREYDYNPKFVESYHINSKQNDRFQFAKQFSQLMISNLNKIQQATTNNSHEQQNQSQWFSIFNNIVDFYNEDITHDGSFAKLPNSAVSTTTRYHDWVSQCKPKWF
jgi:hypothetical protein